MTALANFAPPCADRCGPLVCELPTGHSGHHIGRLTGHPQLNCMEWRNADG